MGYFALVQISPQIVMYSWHQVPKDQRTQAGVGTLLQDYKIGKMTINLIVLHFTPNAIKVAGNPEFSRSTNREFKLIEFFALVNF